MAVEKKILEALNLKKLNLPPEPRILEMKVEPYVDQTGDDALRIWLTIDEETDIEKVSGRAILELKQAVHDSLLAHGIELYPYITFGKPSEFVEVRTGE